ncbi:MAG: hypothetical protein RL386_974 [Bacteroidota bacterium]|jgi:hypothetical protein
MAGIAGANCKALNTVVKWNVFRVSSMPFSAVAGKKKNGFDCRSSGSD